MKFDAERFLNDYDLPVWTEGKNVQEGWINTTCLFCDDHSNHLGFNPYENYCNCWRCGHHSLWDTIKLLTGDSNVKDILGKYSVIYDEDREVKEKISNSSIILPGTKPLGIRHKKYLEKRNFDPDYIAMKYDLRGVNYIGDYKFRLIIPIYFQGKIISFQGRDITNQSSLRYFNCLPEDEIIPLKDTLFNIDNCQGDSCIAVEGVFDSFRLGDNSLCTFGTSFTEAQAKLLRKYKRVFLLNDNEEEAQKKAEKLGIMLNSTGTVVELIGGIEDDPGNMSDMDALYLKKELGVY